MTYPTTSTAPGATFTYGDAATNPLPSVPSAFRLAAGMFLHDMIRFVGGFLLVAGAGGLLLLSAAIASHNLPAAIAMVLVTCFGAGFAGYVATRVRGDI